jgi:Rrf2 family protein
MRISAKVDYAMRAMTELAVAPDGVSVKAERLAELQGIPLQFLQNILQDLRRAGLVESHRGRDGGSALAKPAEQITVADVIRAIDGPLGAVAGVAPEQVDYAGAAARLRETWVAVRAGVRDVLEQITIADIAYDQLPESVDELLASPGAWTRR